MSSYFFCSPEDVADSGSNALDSSEAAMEVPKTLLKLKTENENILMLLGKLKIYT